MAGRIIKITLTGAPQSTNHIYKSVCRGNRPCVYMTNEGKALKEKYQWETRAQYRGELIANEPLEIWVTLYFANNLRRDWDNWHKISMDALTGIVWKDDSQIVMATITKKIDKKNPRIEIFIT